MTQLQNTYAPWLRTLAGAIAVLGLINATALAQSQSRTTISMHRYEGVADTNRQSKFGEFRGILKRRINRLAEEFVSQGSEYTYLHRLTLIDTGQDAGSPHENARYWDATNSLQLLSGSVFHSDDKTIVFTNVYLGELAKFLHRKTVEVELEVTVAEYRKTRDLYTAVTLYALAMDAVGKLSSDVVSRYLSEAKNYVRDLGTSDAIASELETSINAFVSELAKGTPASHEKKRPR